MINVVPQKEALFFAKSDSHADDHLQIVRDVFGEENEFCRKMTCREVERFQKLQAQLHKS